MEMHICVRKVSNGFIISWGPAPGEMPPENIIVTERNSYYGLSNTIEEAIKKEFFPPGETE